MCVCIGVFYVKQKAIYNFMNHYYLVFLIDTKIRQLTRLKKKMKKTCMRVLVKASGKCLKKNFC